MGISSSIIRIRLFAMSQSGVIGSLARDRVDLLRLGHIACRPGITASAFAQTSKKAVSVISSMGVYLSIGATIAEDKQLIDN
jgi:hypothetical protein